MRAADSMMTRAPRRQSILAGRLCIATQSVGAVLLRSALAHSNVPVKELPRQCKAAQCTAEHRTVA